MTQVVKPKMVVLIAKPASGKTYPRTMLVDEEDFHGIETGALIGYRLKHGPEVLGYTQDDKDNGVLLDDNQCFQIVLDELAKLEPDTNVVLDGFCRTLEQAHMLVEQLGDKYELIVCVIEVTDEETRKRLKNRVLEGSHRKDNNPLVHEERLITYQKNFPAIDEYFLSLREKIFYGKIDGMQSKHYVYEIIWALVH